jgi:hypothetical protein
VRYLSNAGAAGFESWATFASVASRRFRRPRKASNEMCLGIRCLDWFWLRSAHGPYGPRWHCQYRREQRPGKWPDRKRVVECGARAAKLRCRWPWHDQLRRCGASSTWLGSYGSGTWTGSQSTLICALIALIFPQCPPQRRHGWSGAASSSTTRRACFPRSASTPPRRPATITSAFAVQGRSVKGRLRERRSHRSSDQQRGDHAGECAAIACRAPSARVIVTPFRVPADKPRVYGAGPLGARADVQRSHSERGPFRDDP